MGLKMNSARLFFFIAADKCIRILLMPNYAILLTYCYSAFRFRIRYGLGYIVSNK